MLQAAEIILLAAPEGLFYPAQSQPTWHLATLWRFPTLLCVSCTVWACLALRCFASAARWQQTTPFFFFSRNGSSFPLLGVLGRKWIAGASCVCRAGAARPPPTAGRPGRSQCYQLYKLSKDPRNDEHFRRTGVVRQLLALLLAPADTEVGALTLAAATLSRLCTDSVSLIPLLVSTRFDSHPRGVLTKGHISHLPW